MHAPKTSCAAMATLVLALLAAPSPAAAAAKRGGRNCSSAGCGGLEIPPYPFGIGTECSLPGFNLTCVTRAGTGSYLLLGKPSIQVIGVADPEFLFTSIGYLVKMAPGVRDKSIHWEAPGRPFAICASSGTSLFVVGCGVKASLFGGDTDVLIGSCSVVCAQGEIMERLPQGLCVGIGCCSINITVALRAFTLNISRAAGQSAKLLEQVNAFITYNRWYSFQLSDLESDLTGNEYPVDLIWAIPYQRDCKRAMEDRANYACVSNHSECLDSQIVGGYLCYCKEGFDGNPYVVNGCVYVARTSVYDFVQPKANCSTSCGNVSFGFPFGTEIGCFAKLQLYLTCNPGPSAPLLQMSDGSVVTSISIDEGILNVLEPSDPSHFAETPLYAFSEEWGVVKWAVDSRTCKNATASKEGYRCISNYSDCVDVRDDKTYNQVGYRCKCSPGFEGNPYLKDGCTDINECLQPDKYFCNGICQNTFGSYTCTDCPHGTDFNANTRKCRPATIILGVSIGLSSGGTILFVAAIFVVLTRKWKRSRGGATLVHGYAQEYPTISTKQ